MTVRDADCECRDAVIRAFGELRKRNMGENAAFESAVSVYRFHHPEVSKLQATDTVDRWLDQS